jgi:hypothetical protein
LDDFGAHEAGPLPASFNVINKEDFDEKKHEVYVEKAEAKKEKPENAEK